MLNAYCKNDVSDEECGKCLIYGNIPCCPPGGCNWKDYRTFDCSNGREYRVNEDQLFAYTENIMRKTLKRYISKLMEEATKDEYSVACMDEWTLTILSENLIKGEICKDGNKKV